MAKTIYFLLPSAGSNYTDFQLDYGALTTVGEDIQFTGSGGVDAVYARPGMIFDFTLSGSGVDKLYLSGSYSSYTTTVSGNVITLSRGSGQTAETVTVSYTSSSLTSDVIVYSDGKLSANTLANFIKNGGTAPVLSTAETSVAPIAPAAAGSSLDANILAYGLNATGDTFASMKPGMKFQAIGGAGVDKVYVSDGGNVDASLLGSSQDLIYLRGAWADYSKTIAGNTLTLARDINGFHEQVVTSFTSSGLTSDKLIFQDGSVTTYAAKAAVLANASVAITSVSGFDAATVTPGVNPSLQASPLSNVTNLDVTSNIVLNYGQNIKGVSGKFIHIVNDGGTGFHGENTTNTLDISVTDLSQVTVVNGIVTINPLRELDLANNYHIMVDAGAFTSTATGAATLAFDGTNLLKFSTVTPGTSASGDMTQAALSQAMDASGNLVNSYKWFDIEKLGTPAASLALDLSTGKYALVAKDYNAAGATYLPDPSQGNQLVAVDDGIQVGDFNVAPSGFGADDWVYIDNQNNALNDLTATSVVSKGTAPTVVLFTGIIDAANSNSGLGGQIKLTLAGTPNGFVSIPAMQTYLQTSLPPVYTDPGSVTVTPATQTVTGTVSDGYISGAAVYLDINKNGKYDSGTDVQVGTTDATGKFTGTINQANASSSLLVVGGTDTSTGLAFTGVLKYHFINIEMGGSRELVTSTNNEERIHQALG